MKKKETLLKESPICLSKLVCIYTKCGLFFYDLLDHSLLGIGIPCHPLLSLVIEEVARVGGAELIVMPGFILMSVYEGEMIGVSEQPSEFQDRIPIR